MTFVEMEEFVIVTVEFPEAAKRYKEQSSKFIIELPKARGSIRSELLMSHLKSEKAVGQALSNPELTRRIDEFATVQVLSV